jgi:hypothetical protein
MHNNTPYFDVQRDPLAQRRRRLTGAGLQRLRHGGMDQIWGFTEWVGLTLMLVAASASREIELESNP